MNIFLLAELQIKKEGREPTELLLLDRAVKIRKWLDKHRGIADRILKGDKFYQYKNTFKTYCRA
jgi:hypothetical protein